MWMYWRLWRLYQLLLQFMNSFLMFFVWFHFNSCLFSIPVCRNIPLWVVCIFLGTCEDPDLQPAFFVLFHNVCSMLCSLKDPWSVAHKHNTRVCVCQTYKNLSLNWHWWLKTKIPKKLGEIHRNRLLLDGALTTWKKSDRHPAEATLATTSETLDRGDGLSV